MSLPPVSRTGDAHRGSPGPTLAIVAAVASNGVIGVGGTLPWRLPHDLRHFRALTLGHAVIMGRRTWESLAGPLAGRENIVVTSRSGSATQGARTVRSLDEALAAVTFPAPAFCIGGGELYREALARATTLHLTEIARAYEGDVLFPTWRRDDWAEVAREAHRSDDGLDYAFVTYERRLQARA